MTELEVDPARVGAAAQQVRRAGREVTDSTTALARLISGAGQAAGEPAVLTAAEHCSRQLSRWVLHAGQAGMLLGEELGAAAEHYRSAEQHIAGTLTDGPRP